jgi:hypothetical protein
LKRRSITWVQPNRTLRNAAVAPKSEPSSDVKVVVLTATISAHPPLQFRLHQQCGDTRCARSNHRFRSVYRKSTFLGNLVPSQIPRHQSRWSFEFYAGNRLPISHCLRRSKGDLGNQLRRICRFSIEVSVRQDSLRPLSEPYSYEFAPKFENIPKIFYKPLIILTRWRRGRDSNPRYPFRYAGFQDRSHQPLGHLSAVCRSPSIVRRIRSIYGTRAPQSIPSIRDPTIKRAQSRGARWFRALVLLLPLKLVGQRSHAVDLPHSLDHPG